MRSYIILVSHNFFSYEMEKISSSWDCLIKIEDTWKRLNSVPKFSHILALDEWKVLTQLFYILGVTGVDWGLVCSGGPCVKEDLWVCVYTCISVYIQSKGPETPRMQAFEQHSCEATIHAGVLCIKHIFRCLVFLFLWFKKNFFFLSNSCQV